MVVLLLCTAAIEAMEESGCCELTLTRVHDGERPGALWHIFDPQDADKIRDLLNKVNKPSAYLVIINENTQVYVSAFLCAG